MRKEGWNFCRRPSPTHPRTQPCLAHNSAEVAIVQVACIERAPELSREDEALVAVLGSDQEPLLRLSGTVRSDGERGQHHDAPAFVGLRWYELPRLVLRRSPAHEASLHVDTTLIKVEVRPSERDHLAGPESTRERHAPKREVANGLVF